MDKVICKVCGAERKQITAGHVRQHGFKDIQEYLAKYPNAKTCSQSTSEAHQKGNKLKISNPIQSETAKTDFHIPKSRIKKRITYAGFLDLLNQGYSLREMKNQGISRHQISFYSVFAQNKIKLTKEQFQTEYLSGKTLKEIAKRHDIQSDHITYLREHLGIPRLGPKFINRKKTEKPLTFRQKKIIYGGLMGDACKMSPASIKMKQSIKQKEYLLWKYSELKEHVSPVSLQEYSQYDKRYDKTYYGITFYTNANTEIETVVQQFYGSGKKYITDEILENLDELSFAIWFMDDGKTGWSYANWVKTGWATKPESTLCTESFTEEENQRICDWFYKKWGINCYLRKQRKEGCFRVVFRTTTVKKFHDIIRPYFVPSLLYKIDWNIYVRSRTDDPALLRIAADRYKNGKEG